jgi:hypothetical protein
VRGLFIETVCSAWEFLAALMIVVCDFEVLIVVTTNFVVCWLVRPCIIQSAGQHNAKSQKAENFVYESDFI